jgi:homoserine kinase
VPHKHVRTAKARAAMPAHVPLTEAVHNVGHASLLVLGLVRGDWDLVAEGLHDKLHQPRRSSLYPQSMSLVRRAQELGALGATISGAGPTVLFWTHYDATGAVMARLKPATAGWASLLHVPFEPQGAFVREL